MVSKDELHNSELENILAEALDRLEAGEAPGTVVQSYPEAYKAELQDMLMVIDVTTQYAADEIPLPTMPRRNSARRDFLGMVSDLRSSQEEEIASAAIHTDAASATDSVTENGLSSSASQRLADVDHSEASGPFALFTQLGEYLQTLFVPATGRFAPIAIGALMLVLMSTASAFTVAWASIPGDLAYPLKEWARRVGLELVPEADRPAVMRAQEQARAEEVMLAQEKADRSAAVIQESLTGIFHGFRSGNGSLDLGATIVIPQYQPDANQDDLFLPMQISGDLIPGSEVRLDYQIIPGQQGLVQGIQLTVLAPPTPSPTPSALPAATYVPPTIPQPTCTVSIPSGWVGYRVQPGDSLGAVSARFGVAPGRLEQVNCLVSSGQINSGSLLYVPPAVVNTVAPAQPAPPIDTATPVDLATATEGATEVATETVLAPDTVTPDATLIITSTALPLTAEPTATSDVIVTVIASPTLVITATAAPIDTQEPAITSTVTTTGTEPNDPEPIETATPQDGEPTPEPVETPVPETTDESSPTPDDGGTPLEVTVESSPVVITSIPTETAEGGATDEPTVEPSIEPTLESGPTSDGSQGDVGTSTVDAPTPVPTVETATPVDTADPAVPTTDATSPESSATPAAPAPAESTATDVVTVESTAEVPPEETATLSAQTSVPDGTEPDTEPAPTESAGETPEAATAVPTTEPTAVETQAAATAVPTDAPVADTPAPTATVPPVATETPNPTNTPPRPPEPPTAVPASTNTPAPPPTAVPPTPVQPTPIPPTSVPPTEVPESSSDSDTGGATDSASP